MKLFRNKLIVIWWCKQCGSFIWTTEPSMLSQIKIIPGCKIFVKINKTIGTLEPTTNNPILSLQMGDIGMVNLQKENAMKWMIGLINSIHCWKVWISSSRNTELPRTNWLSKFRKSCMRFVFCICNRHDYDIRSHPSIV